LTKKKKARKPRREPTKHQLSRWQQQKRKQRIILSSVILVIAAAVVIVATGWYISQYRPLQQTVIRVNQTEFKMGYYLDLLKLISRNQPEQYIDLMADTIARDIEQNELVRQGALKLGISVSDDELKAEIESAGLPNNDVHRDIVRNQMLMGILLDEYFEQQVPVSAEQTQTMVMLLESESQAVEVRARLESGESFTELAEEFSLATLAETNQGDFGWHPKNILAELLRSSIPVEYAFSAEVGGLSQPLHDEEIVKGVSYWLIRVLDRNEEAEEAHVLAMSLGSEEEAKSIKARLEAGEDFATLAKEYSQLSGVEDNGGDLDMVMQGSMSPAADEVIFSPELELGTLSEPIRDETVASEGGYWLVKVLDKDDNRQIEDSDRDLLKANALDDWIISLWEDPANEVDDSLLDEEKKAWAIEQAKKR
jgi:parvulin-like peptidyl-prolyl isomerase